MKMIIEEQPPQPSNLRKGKYVGDCPECRLVLCDLDKIEGSRFYCPRCGNISKRDMLFIRKNNKDIDVTTWSEDRKENREYEKRLQSRLPTVGPKWLDGIGQIGNDNGLQRVPEGSAEGSWDRDDDIGTVRQSESV